MQQTLHRDKHYGPLGHMFWRQVLNSTTGGKKWTLKEPQVYLFLPLSAKLSVEPKRKCQWKGQKGGMQCYLPTLVLV